MTEGLTPYDTGERLEPRPWPLIHRDHFGLVDFDDDEGATAFTVVGKRFDDGSPGLLLSISTGASAPSIEVDGERALVLDEATLAGLAHLVELARRGREDFNHQAEATADYSDEDVRAAGAAWSLAQHAIDAIEGGRP